MGPIKCLASLILFSALLAPNCGDIYETIPWFKDLTINDGVLELRDINYFVGLNETLELSTLEECKETPIGGPGHCNLLHACPQVHHVLTDWYVVLKYFCDPKPRYAGICYPDP